MAGDQVALVDDQKIPEFGRSEVTRQCQHRTLLMNLRMGQSVRPHDIDHQGNESIHVLAAGDACTFALVSLAGFNLLLCGCFSLLPESFDSLAGLLFVIDKIKRHLFPVASKAGFFFVIQAVQLERCPVARLHVSLRCRINQLDSQRLRKRYANVAGEGV
jgi:hypothetical protein